MRHASSFPAGWRDQPPQVEEHAKGQRLVWAVRGGRLHRPVLAQSSVTTVWSADGGPGLRVRVELLTDGLGASVDASLYPWFGALQWHGPVALPSTDDEVLPAMSPEGRAAILAMLGRPAGEEPHGPPRPDIIPTWTDGEPDNLAAAVADAVEWLDWTRQRVPHQADRLERCRDALVRLAHEAIRETER